MAQQAWYKRLWKRIITASIAILLLLAGALIWILNTEHLIKGDWSNILPTVFIVLAVIVALLTWLLPFPPDGPEPPQLPLARELVHKRESFRMGDTTAANFDYITEPIKHAYETARQAVHDASVGAGSKRGILIFGIANTGKTRLAFEALTQTLPDWKVLLWNATYDTLSKVPVPTVSRSSGLVVFIDDLQEYVPAEGPDAEGRGSLSDNRTATLQAFLQTMQTAERLVVVATCRLEDETRVGARLRWLFDQLKVITLRSFTDPESATIIDLFRQHGVINVGDWDGTLGSLVLGLSKKRSQYEQLVHSHHPAVAVLHAMKLLSLAFITVHTYSRIQGVCTGIFGESTLQEGTKTWQDSIAYLTRLEFMIEEKDQASGNYALVIRKDTYFDKVITDYPASNRPYQLEQHFEQLQKVFVGLNDSSALFNLANAYYLNRKRHEEALATYEQAIRLDPKLAPAYTNKGSALGNLKRHEEALAAYDQALSLDPNLAVAYYNKGIALRNLKRYEEALVAYDQALGLDPNDTRAYNGKGLALGEVKRYEEALAAFEQALRLDPNDTRTYNGKGLALRNLKRYEEALAAFEQALRLDPNDAIAYTNKGMALYDLKWYEEALVAFERALRLDPNDAIAYAGKEELLRMLGREGGA